MRKANGSRKGHVMIGASRLGTLETNDPSQSAFVPFGRPAPSTTRAVLCAATTGVLLWLSFFPAACGWLGWVAFVPLLALVRADVSGWRLFLAAWVAGVLFYFPAIQWMRVADYRMYFTWLGLSLYCSLLVPLAIFFVRRLDRHTRLPLVVTLPVVWAGLEYFRAHFGTGFPWYFVGYTQQGFLMAAQIADLAGVYAVSFILLAVNGVVFEWLYRVPRIRRALRLREPDPKAAGWPLGVQTAICVAAVGATLVYGWWRLGQQDFTPGPRVALIQGNLDQRLCNEASSPDGEQARREVLDHYVRLNDWAALLRPKPDLIVWPETSYPDFWGEDAPGKPDADSAKLAQEVANRWRTNVLLGINAVVGKEPSRRKYNSALLIRASEHGGEVGGRYDKIHLVPFGEYVPFKDWLPWMSRFAPYDYDYSIHSGEGQPRLRLGNDRFGVLICYEDTDPYLGRQYVRRGTDEPTADFLLNISNDGWFDGTSEHDEHLAICRFRAIECRRPVARAVNMGISAVVDGNGRVLRPRVLHSPMVPEDAPLWEVKWAPGELPELPCSEWSRFKKAPAVIVASLPLDRRPSLYAQWGDWLPQMCWLIVAAGMIASLLRSRGMRPGLALSEGSGAVRR